MAHFPQKSPKISPRIVWQLWAQTSFVRQIHLDVLIIFQLSQHYPEASLCPSLQGNRNHGAYTIPYVWNLLIHVGIRICLPSSSCLFGPAFRLAAGDFMKSGKRLRSPRMSMNLLQLSTPSGPIMAWSRTFIAVVFDIFFSLKYISSADFEVFKIFQQIQTITEIKNAVLKWTQPYSCLSIIGLYYSTH